MLFFTFFWKRNILVFSTPGISYMGLLNTNPLATNLPPFYRYSNCLLFTKHRVLSLPSPSCSSPEGSKYNMSKLMSPYLPTAIGERMDQISKKTPNPKCRLFLKLTSKLTWGQVFMCLWPLPHPPPRNTLYGYSTHPCSYSHREGRGG